MAKGPINPGSATNLVMPRAFPGGGARTPLQQLVTSRKGFTLPLWETGTLLPQQGSKSVPRGHWGQKTWFKPLTAE